jgi:hypothetical protein
MGLPQIMTIMESSYLSTLGDNNCRKFKIKSGIVSVPTYRAAINDLLFAETTTAGLS